MIFRWRFFQIWNYFLWAHDFSWDALSFYVFRFIQFLRFFRNYRIVKLYYWICFNFTNDVRRIQKLGHIFHDHKENQGCNLHKFNMKFLRLYSTARKNLYKILGISDSASSPEIKKAYFEVKLKINSVILTFVSACKKIPSRYLQGSRSKRKVSWNTASLWNTFRSRKEGHVW